MSEAPKLVDVVLAVNGDWAVTLPPLENLPDTAHKVSETGEVMELEVTVPVPVPCVTDQAASSKIGCTFDNSIARATGPGV